MESICSEHNDKIYSFCNECNKDICVLCIGHEKHNQTYINSITINEKDYKNIKKNMKILNYMLKKHMKILKKYLLK